jgi:membrane protein EpsK
MPKVLMDLGPALDGTSAEQVEVQQSTLNEGVGGANRDLHPAKRGRFATNLAANIGGLVISLLMGVWYTPYLIRHLGVASFGLIPLVVQITGYLAILTLALNAAVGRWITIALERREYDEANRYFNASFFGSLILIAVLAVPASLAAANIHRLVRVPAGQEAQAGLLMGCALVVFFLNELLTPFGVATYCTNRFDLRNLVDIVQRLLQIAAVVALFSLMAPRLRSVGFAMVAATLVGVGMNIRLWRKLTPTLRISKRWFDIRAIGRLASFGGWVSVNQVGTLLFLAVDLLVVNRLFGAVAGGRYAAVMQWSGLLRTLAASIAGVFGPTILYIFARDDTSGVVVYTRRAMKFMGLILALPIGLVCGLSAPLLRTWLGPEFTGLAPLMSLMTIHLSVNLAVLPLFNVQGATNRVVLPGIVTLVMGAANLGLALLLAGPANWGLYGVAAAGAIMLTAKNLLFTPVYCAACVGCNALEFLRPVLRIALLTAATAGVCYGLSRLVPLTGWLRLGAAAMAVTAVYAIAVLLTQVSATERGMLRDAALSLARSRSYGVTDKTAAETEG